jgi:ribonucleoside-triphosphate reductase
VTNVNWGPIGYLTYKRTYARPKADNTTEEFPESVERVIAACRDQLKVGFTQDEENRLRDHFYKMKCSVAGRFWWQLGTETVNRLGLFSLQNCAGVVVDNPIKPFVWAMDALMLGSGVGYNIQKEYVYQLPKPKKVAVVRKDAVDADFIVPDSREGWVSLLERTLTAHFKTGKGFTYSAHCVRGKGASIKGFGGVASGPEELCWGITEISKILNGRAGKKMNPVDCLDIMNIIGFVVVSGNVRRSAQLAVGDMEDRQFLNAKRWDIGTIPNWRAMSNNTVVCNDINLLPDQFWQGYEGNGEPYGLVNMKLAQSCGRTGETQYPDKKIVIFNPCVEQNLESYETCCLSELFLPNIRTEDELRDTMRMMYRINKHSLALPCHQPKTQAVVHRNMRMGIGVTGYLQASDEQRGWLKDAYTYIRAFDKTYSDLHGFPTSIKLTTVKPSGTLSLLAGVTPGCHPGYSQYFIRRIRMASNIPLVEVCRQSGYAVEYQKNFDGSADHNTVVVSFPCSFPKGTTVAKDVDAIAQLEVVRRLQAEWSDNAVSCTIYYRRDELPGIKAWLKEHYNDSIKACSFLLHSDHGFVQAPYEEITEDVYNDLKSKTKPITGLNASFDTFDSDECATGSCPVK